MMMALIMAGSWLSEFFAAFAEKFAERFSSNKDIGAEISEAIMQVQMYETSEVLQDLPCYSAIDNAGNR